VGESERREKSKATDRAARDHSEAELGSARVKTARLKAERLARDGRDQPAEPEAPLRAAKQTRARTPGKTAAPPKAPRPKTAR
jgi:hypothetical protein